MAGSFAGKNNPNYRHGLHGTREYRIWKAMRTRCNNPNMSRYHRYGGRGISICPEWDDFNTFFRDMGPCPEGYSIDRIDNDGNYTPENCRWADNMTQSANRSQAKLHEHDGLALTPRGWANHLGVTYGCVRSALRRGVSIGTLVERLRAGG